MGLKSNFVRTIEKVSTQVVSLIIRHRPENQLLLIYHHTCNKKIIKLIKCYFYFLLTTKNIFICFQPVYLLFNALNQNLNSILFI